jgi:hypothetical protein
MVACSFVQTHAKYSPADGLLVNFETMTSSEEILIAAEFLNESDDGHIGEGFTKGLLVSKIPT